MRRACCRVDITKVESSGSVVVSLPVVDHAFVGVVGVVSPSWWCRRCGSSCRFVVSVRRRVVVVVICRMVSVVVPLSFSLLASLSSS